MSRHAAQRACSFSTMRRHAGGRPPAGRRGGTGPADAHRIAGACATKRAVKRDAMRDCGRRCVYCALPLQLEMATLDHVQPLARGGTDSPGNLVTACGPCNRMKGDMLPLDFFARYPWAGLNFMRYARAAHRAFKRGARRAVSLACAA